MTRHGFIHDKLDIKVLLLYLLSRVAMPIDFSALTELALCDDGIDYFDYAECVDELVVSEHATLDEQGLYAITEKGQRNGAITESGLPYSVRLKCDKALKRLNAVLRRAAQVRVELLPREDESFTLRLILDDLLGDGCDNIMTIELLAGSAQQAKSLGERFREEPERIYNGLISLLAPPPSRRSTAKPVEPNKAEAVLAEEGLDLAAAVENAKRRIDSEVLQ